MDRKRLLELAVEELERQKAKIVADIEIVRSELSGTGKKPRKVIVVPGRLVNIVV